MIELDTAELGRRAEGMIQVLALASAVEGQITRLYLTPEHRRAADIVGGWMQAAGMVVSEDGLGTMRGRLPARHEGEGTRRLLIGSHIDTVVDAGAYDGPLGVVAGILAAEHLAVHGKLALGLDVLAFGDEEGSRFPATLLCSSAVAGRFDPATLAVEAADGTTVGEALRAYGLDAARAGEPRYRPGEAAAYVELHIEQGPVLERAGEPLGVVTAIAGQTRLLVTVVGEAGHAGTVPMPVRRDALAAAAEMMLTVEAIARSHDEDFMVGTVGTMQAAPGAPNVIPGRVTFTVDVRSQTDSVRLAALAAFRDAVQDIAERRRVTAWAERVHDVPAVACDPALQAALAAAAQAEGCQPVLLPSGAGHDGQAMGALCPIGMLFVRSRGGISHNPAEYTSVEDMGVAVAAMIRFAERFSA